MLTNTKRILSIAVWGLLLASCSAPLQGQRDIPPVKLVVLISVDQLPQYLLERYDTLYSGGLRRLLDQGRSYTRAEHDHAFTVTAPGHATLATGMVPARHGIVYNEWYEREGGEWRYVHSVNDGDERIVGFPHLAGKSPRKLEVAALPDWLAAANSNSRVFTASGKSRAAVLMAGRTRGHVYHFEDDVGRFVTSTYYRDADPEWVARFHEDVLSQFFSDSTWELTVPQAAHRLARADSAEFEYRGTHTAFPHNYRQEVDEEEAGDPQEFYNWWDHTPALDAAVLAFGEAAVNELSLGRRGSVDYLALGLSQLDRVGHRFGPLSLEQLDAILRLDRALGEFLEFLDSTVGEGRYVVGFSSDHGVLPIPEYPDELGLSKRRITSDEWRAVRDAAGNAAASSGSPTEAEAALVEALEAADFIADVMTLDELASGEPADSFVALYQRSYCPVRLAGSLARQGLVVRLVEGAHSSSDATTHGTPYVYDRHVPLILMGPGVPAGSSDDAVRTVDMAPTLAELAGIPYPDDLDGRPLIRAAR
ncbi:MAG: alkaline phosphatase family protein [Gemmatimonadota bacterium]|nr:MAG: alkaline phosphatase family protein [Gemmatimonadota bacterium]